MPPIHLENWQSVQIQERQERSDEVDVIRMAALLGICVVNVPFMALPAEAAFIPPTHLPDKLAALFIECFFQLKFFLLFSFLFGWGMAIQARAASAAGRSFSQHYFRRMAGLAVFGSVHACLVFSGDILLLYALLGSLLWLIRDFPPRKLMLVCACMLPFSMVTLSTLAILIDAATMDGASALASTERAGLGGSYLEATSMRMRDWPSTWFILLLLQGPLAFGAFTAGLAAARSGFFARDSGALAQLSQRLPLLVGIALPLNCLYAAVVGGLVPAQYSALSMAGFALAALGAPALALIYLYGLVRIARTVRLPRILILAGRNSLSAYVAQGVIAGAVFGAYGLGKFDRFGAAILLPIALGIALGAMLAVGIHARAFGRGPLESLLRKISGK